MALGTVPQPIGVAKPTLADLVKHTDGNQYALAMFAAKRARQINAYFNQLNEGLLQNVGPLVEYDAKEKPLSIAFREINEGLLEQTLADNNESDTAKEAQTAAEVKEEIAKDEAGKEKSEEEAAQADAESAQSSDDDAADAADADATDGDASSDEAQQD
jgi:DNA-directed RNA polymerase subunit omega